MYPDDILNISSQSINLILDAVNKSFQGKKAEINEIENALKEIDKEILEKLSKQSPEKILKYISQKIDLKLKIEELKQKKETTIWHLFKSLMPFLAPIVAALIGLLIGANLSKEPTSKLENEKQLENRLIIETLDIESTVKRNERFGELIELGFIKHNEGRIKKLIHNPIIPDTIKIQGTERIDTTIIQIPNDTIKSQ